ncbi:MAG TPA: hypothetical protein VNU19_11420 [Candidatus Acidoferrum sp.]|jgi:hypothetical protein|nr:hypothetical protein [Candidatus Acidoferrum sp.]
MAGTRGGAGAFVQRGVIRHALGRGQRMGYDEGRIQTVGGIAGLTAA